MDKSGAVLVLRGTLEKLVYNIAFLQHEQRHNRRLLLASVSKSEQRRYLVKNKALQDLIVAQKSRHDVLDGMIRSIESAKMWTQDVKDCVRSLLDAVTQSHVPALPTVADTDEEFEALFAEFAELNAAPVPELPPPLELPPNAPTDPLELPPDAPTGPLELPPDAPTTRPSTYMRRTTPVRT